MTTVEETVRQDRSAFYKNATVAGYADVPFEEKERLFGLVKADMRFPDYLYGCYECGICVAAWAMRRGLKS